MPCPTPTHMEQIARFWPVRCGTINIDALRHDRDQLWAEAVFRYGQGAIWWFDEPDLIALVEVEQEERYQADAWDPLIDRWLIFERRRVNRGYVGYDDWQDEEVERTAPLTDVSVGEILEHVLRLEPAKWSKIGRAHV
mgnify:CR=1 FL=1